jgi:hypothetical protein
MSASRPSCHHLHSTGQRCGSPALRGEQFCFYHHPTRRPPIRTRPAQPGFYIPPITDPEELQIALSEIIGRLADNTLDPQRAGLLLASLQMAKANLAAIPAHRPKGAFTGAASPDFSDLSGLLSVLGLQQTPFPPGH